MKKSGLNLKRLVSFILICMIVTSLSLAHSGRTDSSGGHKDNQNVSGLGYYHFHCGGHPPHLHDGGVCPYASSSNVPTVTPKIPVSTPIKPIVIAPVVPVVLSEICVRVNGQKVLMIDAPPFVENGRTYVPVRAVLEAYGVDSIAWEAPFVIVKKSDVTLRIPVGQNYIDKNGSQLAVDSPAMIRESRTCLPIRAVIEALGGTVGWDANTRTVIITRSTVTSTTSLSNLKVSFIDVGQGDSVF